MIGKTLAHYETLEMIGSGGMGSVYRARDSKLGREVALKLLPPEFSQDSERVARFQREAQALASLHHPNIASIFGLEYDNGVRFLAMELVEGEDLAQRLARGPLPLDEAVDIARQIATGLEEAHENGLVHRDLKPANVKLTPDGKAKILDFGLARAYAGEPADSVDVASSPTITPTITPTNTPVTQQGVIMGTAAYMSPEQARGKPVDRRADIWAFGVILWEMLTGKELFQGETTSDILAHVLTFDPDWDSLPATIPPHLRRLLRRCLQKDPSLRLRSAADAALELDEDESYGVVPAGEATSPSTQVSMPRRLLSLLPWVLAALAILLWARSQFVGQDPPATSPRLAFTQLTDVGGMERYPSLSPDGRFFLYAAESGGDLDIFLQRAGGRRPINLTENSTERDDHPACSPDGELVAFTSSRGGGGIFVMGATGESIRKISSGGSHPAWSPDGQQIVFETELFENPWAREEISQLWIVGVDGQNRRLLTEGDAVQPSWSPHGHRIAFWKVEDATGGQRDIWTVRSDGTDLQPVTQDAALDWSPKWSRDGRYLYFASDRGGLMNLWRVAIDEQSGQTLGDPESVTLPTHTMGPFSISWDGSQIAYTSLNLTSHLHAANFDPRAGEIGRPVPLTGGSLRVDSPEVSPDGEWIAFRRLGQPEDLYLVRSDGTGLRKLTDDQYRDRGPYWTPDGQRIIFYSDRAGRYEVWSIRPDGSDLRQLSHTEGRSLWFPRWSPDDKFAAAINEEGTTLLAIDPATSELSNPELLPPVAEGRFFYGSAWSSDGQRLAGWSSDKPASTVSDLVIYDLSTRTYEVLADNADGWPGISWLADGSGLVYGAVDGIRMYDLGTGQSRIVRGDEVVQREKDLTLSPDGRQIILTIRSVEGDLWLASH